MKSLRSENITRLQNIGTVMASNIQPPAQEMTPPAMSIGYRPQVRQRDPTQRRDGRKKCDSSACGYSFIDMRQGHPGPPEQEGDADKQSNPDDRTNLERVHQHVRQFAGPDLTHDTNQVSVGETDNDQTGKQPVPVKRGADMMRGVGQQGSRLGMTGIIWSGHPIEARELI